MEKILSEKTFVALSAVFTLLALVGSASLAIPSFEETSRLVVIVGLVGMAGFGGLSMAFRGL